MKKHIVLSALAVAGLLVIGAGCGGGDSYTANVDNVNGLTTAEGDKGEAKALKADTGLDLPSDAAVSVRLSNGTNTTATYITDLSPEEVKAFYEEELTGNGYTESRAWFEAAAAGFGVTSGLYSDGTTVVNVSISANGEGSSVALQVDEK